MLHRNCRLPLVSRRTFVLIHAGAYIKLVHRCAGMPASSSFSLEEANALSLTFTGKRIVDHKGARQSTEE